MRILKIDDSVPIKRCLFSNPAASQPCYNKDEQICDPRNRNFLKQTINIYMCTQMDNRGNAGKIDQCTMHLLHYYGSNEMRLMHF